MRGRDVVSILALIAWLPLAVCCAKSESEEADETAAENISAFVSAQLAADSTFTATYNNGVVRLIVASGSGDALAKGGKVTFWYAAYAFTSSAVSQSNLFATNMSSIASSAGWNLSGEDAFLPVEATLGSGSLLRGLELGLEGVQAGEDCYILFVSSDGFGGRGYGTVSANTALAYRINVESVEN